MFKKFCCFAIALLCLLPGVSFANDAIGYEDTNQNLSLSYKLLKNEIEIGGELNFSLTLKNNSSETFCNFYLVDIFYDNNYNKSNFSGEDFFGDLTLAPGEKAIVDISAQIAEDIYWYKIENEYFADFNIIINYDSYQNVDDDYWNYWFLESDSTPVKITNLLDGSQFLSFESEEKQPWVFTEFNSKYSDKEYYSQIDKFLGTNIKTDYKLTNKYNYKISNVYVNIDYFDSFIIEDLEPLQEIQNTIEGYAIIKKDTDFDELEIKTQALFKLDDKYYCIQSTKVQPFSRKQLPDLEISIVKDFFSDDHYILSITNLSGNDFDSFYVDFNDINDYHYSLSNFTKLSSNQTLQCSLSNTDKTRYLIIGYVEDDILYTWSAYCDFKPEGGELSYIQSLSYFNINELTTPAPNPTPAPTSSPEPTTSPVTSPSQTLAPTPTASPMPSPTTTPTPEIAVNSVTIKPAVPVWVWIALGCALLATGFVSILLNIKRSKEED